MKSLSKLKGYWDEHRAGALYTVSSVAKAGVQVVVGFFLVRYIGPEDLGLWNAASVVTTYAMFLQAGLLNGLNRELPFNLGSGNVEKAQSMAGTSQTFTVLGCIISALGGAAAVGVYSDRSGKTLFVVLAITAVLITTFYTNYLTVTFRSKNSFLNLSLVQFVVAALSLLTIPMVYFWSFNGMLSRIIILSAILVVLLFVIRPIRPGLTWDWRTFRELMKTGLPIFVLSYLETSAATSDRLALVKYAGVEQVGYYSLGLMIWQGLTSIPMSVTSYFYSRMTFRFGGGVEPNALWRSALKATALVFLLTLPLVAVGWYLLPWLVPVFFPRYIPGIRAAQLLLASALFFTATIGVNVLWSMKVWKYMIGYQLTSALFKAVAPFAGALIFPNILEGVALGVVVAHFLTFIIGLSLTYIATHRPAAVV